MNFLSFYKLGNESFQNYNNKIIRLFIRFFGPLGINAKIRSGHVLRNIINLELPQQQEIKILDVGCGVSYVDIWLAKKYSNWKIHGIDIDENVIINANNIKNLFSLTNIIFEQNSISDFNNFEKFDLICSMDVLEHVQDDISALKNMNLALRNNGNLILHLPIRYNMNHRILPGFKDYFTIDHVRPEYTLDEINNKLDSTGFIIKKMYYSFSFWGELAFELNYLFWKSPKIRFFIATATHFFSNLFGYIDIKNNHNNGNGMVIHAIKKVVI